MANDLITRLLLNNSNFDRNLSASTKLVQQFKLKVADIDRGILAGFGKIPSIINPLSSSFSTLALKVGAAGASIAAIGEVVKLNIQYNKELDQSLSALKAITGDTADTMDRYRDAAILLGRTTPQTAAQVGEAFKIVAQMKPELALVLSALIDTTEAALNLANAQGTDVATAAEIVVRALNVYNVSAREAERFTNVLAAGMRNGSGDIEWLGTAFGKAGATVKTVGMSYEETIATLELLSRRIKDATSAGAQLRNVLIYLEKQNNENFKPSVVGISQAIKNLKAEEMDLSLITNMFRKQNVEAITTLMNYSEEFDNLKEKITGTNTAFEMAQERLNNLTGAVKRLDSAWQSFILDLGNSNGVIMKVVDSIANLLNRLAGITPLSSALAKEAKIKTDLVLYDIALLMAENKSSKEDIKKELEKKIAERRKVVEELLKKELYKYNNPRNTGEWNAAALNMSNYNAQLKVLDAASDRIGMIINDAFNQVEEKRNKVRLDELISDDFDIETASIDELNTRIKELKKLRDASNDATLILKYNALIQETQLRIDTLTGKLIKYNNALLRTAELLKKLKEAAASFRKIASGGVALTNVSNNSESNIFSDPELLKAIQDLPDEIGTKLNEAFTKYQTKQSLNLTLLDRGVMTVDLFKKATLESQKELLTELSNIATHAITTQEKAALYDVIVPVLKEVSAANSINTASENNNKLIENFTERERTRFDSFGLSLLESFKLSRSSLPDKLTALSFYKSLKDQLQKAIQLAEIELNNVLGKLDTTGWNVLDTTSDGHSTLEVPEELETKINEIILLFGEWQSYIDKCDEAILELSSDINVLLDALKRVEELNDTLNSTASVVRSIGSAFSVAGDDSTAAIMNIMAQAIALIPVILALALAEGTENAVRSSKHWVEAISGIAAITASIIAACKLKFADGGIVSGGSYSGDKTLVRVNAGEMILNHGLQAKLFRLLNEGGAASSNATSGDVHFRIQGRDLVGVLNNYTNKMGKLK